MYPSRNAAETILQDAYMRNPGPWAKHSILTAMAAERIASVVVGLNPDHAYVNGMLHDIGRRNGPSGLKHATDGYYYLQAQGYEESANVCLSHSFPTKRIESCLGAMDVTEPELCLIRQYFDRFEYNDYDRLIQLCDCIADPDGYCLIEKRLVDVALRYGINQHYVEKLKGYMSLRQLFDQKIGKSIYSVLPGIVKGTFGTDQLTQLKQCDPEAIKCKQLLIMTS